MNQFDFTSPQLVLTGTLWGEARGCGRSGMENVAQCILNRASAGWPGGSGIVGVCLARLQFSCWNTNDPNRSKILAAGVTGQGDTAWQVAAAVATAAIAGHNPDRIGGADSYFARSMTAPPRWAAPPATERFSDGWHRFWRVHPAAGGNAPAVSVQSEADALNARVLAGTFNPPERT